MSKPRIVKETRRAPKERRPPPSSETRPHPWLHPDSLDEYRRVAHAGKGFELYLSAASEDKIRLHAIRDADKGLEVMGFLLGDVRSWEGSCYTVVRDIGTTELKSSASKVRFDPSAFPKLFKGLDSAGFDYIIVGWYHSHPAHTCFLSRIDLETQRSMFRESYHSALVIDPVSEEIKAFKLSGNSYAEIPFAIVKSDESEGNRGNPARRRRLKQTTRLGQGL
ncbi:MAG TPA: Mov34/MPN/PAD-1 family protein [Thermoplasmata archaeon]